MRTSTTLAGIALSVFVLRASAAEPGGADSATPVLWKGVEVVTNDFAAIPRIREATPIAPGALLSLSDPKLRIACDAVRGKFPSSRIVCTNSIEPTKGGPPQAWYVVEVDIPERAPLRCLPGARLDPALGALAREWSDTIGRAVAAGADVRERLNDRDYLDYERADLSTLAARLHGATRGRAVELEAASVSCNPQDRAASFNLMSFSGDAQAFITMAATHINDEVDGVASAAARFLVLFAEFIEPRTVPHIASEACKSVLSGNFAARQKSLNLLNELSETGMLPFEQLTSDCQGQIRNIARTSLALSARELVSGLPR
jgi:hypothetical protein